MYKDPDLWVYCIFLRNNFSFEKCNSYFNLAAPLSSSRVYPEELRTKKPTALGSEWPVDAVLALG